MLLRRPVVHTALESLRSEAGEMAQWFREMATLPEVLDSIPTNHMVA